MKGRKTKAAVLTVAVLVVIIAAAVSAMAMRPDWRYVASDMLRRGDTSLLREVSAGEIITQEYSLADAESFDVISFTETLRLVNGYNPLEEDYIADIAEYGDSGVMMNPAVHGAYAALSAEISDKFDKKLYVMSAYRSAEEQNEVAAENSSVAAEEGESEHQTGLGMDVYVKNYAGYGFLKTDAGQYVNSHCHENGFIIRYPYYGKSHTGIPYEPWHLRYVGEPHAELIYRGRLTLEEYIDDLDPDKFYEYGDYIISRQHDGNTVAFPDGFKKAEISAADNGYVIITATMK